MAILNPRWARKTCIAPSCPRHWDWSLTVGRAYMLDRSMWFDEQNIHFFQNTSHKVANNYLLINQGMFMFCYIYGPNSQMLFWLIIILQFHTVVQCNTSCITYSSFTRSFSVALHVSLIALVFTRSFSIILHASFTCASSHTVAYCSSSRLALVSTQPFSVALHASLTLVCYTVV